MRRALLLAPLALLALFVIAVGWRLARPPSNQVASHLVGQRMPDVGLPPAIPGPRLVNLFASWCVPCIAEVPLLLDLQRGGIAIDGIAVRDRPEATAKFLATRGNPYRTIAADSDGRMQLLLGASGVPETFLVDRAGTIRFQHIGPIAARDLANIRSAWVAAQ